MCSYLYNWYYGYSLLENVDRDKMPQNFTHVLIIKGSGKLNIRKYKNIYDFYTIKLNKIELYYNDIYDNVFSDNYTSFETMSLPEFINFVLPKQELDIYHIKRENYLNNNMKQSFFQKVYMNDGYMCRCQNSSKNCVYHEFISENLYKKYIKNDSSSENTDICNIYDNDWRLV